MNNQNVLNREDIMNKRIYDLLIGAVALLLIPVGALFASCSVEPDEEDLHPITGITVEDYLSGRDDLSSFNYILQRSGYDRLMSSYGTYTCFAPTNDAIAEYINQLWENDEDAKVEHNGMTSQSLEGLTDSLCTDIAMFHLARYEYTTMELSSSSSINTLLGRTILVDPKATSFVLNAESMIIYSTINEEKPNNGTVHVLDKVIPRSNKNVISELERLKSEGYGIFYDAMVLCGFDTLLDKNKKDQTSFENPMRLGTDEGGFYYMDDIKECLVGYTIFAESDDVLRSKGIDGEGDEALLKLIAHANEVYGNSAKSGGWYDYYRNNQITVTTPTSLADESVYKDPCNALYMWVAYHILPCALTKDLLTVDFSVNKSNEYKNYGTYEYYETLLPNTLMKIWYTSPDAYCGSSGQKYLINRYVANNTLTDGLETTGSSSMHNIIKRGIEINTDGVIQALNGYIYPIDGQGELLEYQSYVPDGVLNERIRMDVLSMQPELINNGFKGKSVEEIAAMGDGVNGTRVRFPTDYFDNIKVYNQNTTIDMTTVVTSGTTSWCNYQSDGLQGRSEYDLALKLPPVPDNNYELRIDVTLGGSYFGMTQYYLGTSSNIGDFAAVDLPIDLTMSALDPRIGFTYLYDGGDGLGLTMGTVATPEWEEDKGLETDKVMRTHGYMRGPLCIIKNVDNAKSAVQRYNGYCVRRILTTRNFEQTGELWLRMKAVISGNRKYQIDYVEFCPTSVANNQLYLEDMY